MFESKELLNEKINKITSIIENNNSLQCNEIELWKCFINIKIDRLNNSLDNFINFIEKYKTDNERNDESEQIFKTPSITQMLLLKEILNINNSDTQ